MWLSSAGGGIRTVPLTQVIAEDLDLHLASSAKKKPGSRKRGGRSGTEVARKRKRAS
jgi:hypothetical protein